MADGAADVGGGSGGWQLPGYRMGALIGRGGFAAVYEAQQISLNRPVAVKMLLTDMASESDRRRFEREREILARLSEHPCIVDVYDAGISIEHRPFIVMRLYRAGTLAQRVARSGPLGVAEVVGIVGRLATALDAAHGLKILHRDVKPENALLTDDWEAVLSDFGIATLVDPHSMTHRTHGSTGFFTLAHVAPEVLERAEFSVASDVYALASTAYSLLAGRPPFDVRNPRVTSMILDDPPVSIDRPDLPEPVWEVLQQAMAKRPGERPGSAGAFSGALARAWSSRPAPASSAATSPAVSDHDPTDAVTVMRDPGHAPEQASEQATVLGWHPPAPVEPPVAPQPPSTGPGVTGPGVTGPGVTGSGVTGSSVTRLGAIGPGDAVSIRRRLQVVAAGVALLLAVVVGAGGYLWNRSRFAVGVLNGHVAVHQGAAVQFLGLNLRSTQITPVPIGLLPVTDREKVEHGVTVGSRADADRMVSKLKAQAETCTTSLQPPCPARPASLPNVSATVSPYPHGNLVTITWNEPDHRAGSTTYLRVNGGGPSAGCPTVITAAGHCSFGGSWARTYVVAATVSAPEQPEVIGAQSTVTTYPEPSLTVKAGSKFIVKGEEYCTVLVSATGMYPNRTLGVAFLTDYHQTKGLAAWTSTLDKSTDARGNVTDSEFGQGYRDPSGVGWVSVTIDQLSARRAPWACS